MSMTKKQRAALSALRDAGSAGLPAVRLAEIVGAHVNGVSRTVGSLVDRQLVRRATEGGRVHYFAKEKP